MEFRKAIITSGLSVSPETYLKISLLVSFTSAVFLSLFFYLTNNELSIVLISFFSSFLTLFLLARGVPSVLAGYRAEQIESDLPLAARTIATQLNLKIPFERCLRDIANPNYSCSDEFRRVVNEIDNGSPVPLALMKMSERIDSTIVKKILSQLVLAYTDGKNSSNLKRLAEELIIVQKFKSKEFSAKLSFLSLIYIAITCIVPMLFISYVLISTIFFGTRISNTDIWLVFLAGFPLINLFLIFFLHLKTPKLFNNQSIKLLSEKEKIIIDNLLRSKGINVRFDTFFKLSIFFSVTAAFSVAYFINLFGLLLLSVPFLFYFFFINLNDQKNEQIEQNLPDALFQASMLDSGMPLDKLFTDISKSNFGRISEEFAIIEKQVSAGSPILAALERSKQRVSSELFGRTIDVLKLCYTQGQKIHSVLHETANDMFELNSLVKERKAMISMQKYTILYGGGLIVPLILAMIINITSGLEFPNVKTLTVISQAERTGIIETITQASQVYVFLYVLFACIFVAHQEGRITKFIIYLTVFGTLSLAVFHFAKSSFRLL